MKKSDFILKEKTVKVENGFVAPILIGEWLRSVEDSEVTSLKEGINSELTKKLAQVTSEVLGVNISAEEDELEVFEKTDFGFYLRSKEFDVTIDITYKTSEVEIDPLTESILNSKFGCACQVRAIFLGEKVKKEGKMYVELNYSSMRDGLKVTFGINKQAQPNQEKLDMINEVAGAVVNLLTEMISAVFPDLVKTNPSPEEAKEEELVD